MNQWPCSSNGTILILILMTHVPTTMAFMAEEGKATAQHIGADRSHEAKMKIQLAARAPPQRSVREGIQTLGILMVEQLVLSIWKHSSIM